MSGTAYLPPLPWASIASAPFILLFIALRGSVMKIKPEHIAKMKTAIESALLKHPGLITRYETGDFPRAEFVKDLQKRFCWDLLNSSNLSGFLHDEVYCYADDTHIYTALKSICPKVTRRYI